MIKSTSLKDKISTNRTNWADLIFLAEAEREWFEEVTVVTLKSHYRSVVYDQAWDQTDSMEQLDSQANAIMDSKQIYVQEYIKTNDNSSVEVCVDRPEITDEVINEVLDLLIEYGITPNTQFDFGEKRTYTVAELGSLPEFAVDI